jgi:predicted transcriptional regulator YdeE
MNPRIVYKDAFAVIGKMGQGPAENSHDWIMPLWKEALPRFSEISGIALTNESGGAVGVWGAMNDINEENKRWDDKGKYMAGCEADALAIPPEGWSKWLVPAQTYLVADCSMDAYGEVFGSICAKEGDNIIATVHERYPDPANPNALELWFPIASGALICQSCAMPLAKTEDFGTEADGNPSRDYCAYCYKDGNFSGMSTMEEVIETCIPFCLEAGEYKDAETARTEMMRYYPKLKRWAE